MQQIVQTFHSNGRGKVLLVSFVMLGIGVFFGFIFSSMSINPQEKIDSPFSELREKNSKYPLIGALLDSEWGGVTKSLKYSLIEKEIQSYIKQSKAEGRLFEAAVYVRDLSNGPWIGINQDIDFFPASLLKLPAAMAIYKSAEEDPALLSKIITVPPTNIDEMQSIKPTTIVKSGDKKTVQELIEAMLIYSDNNAFITLVSELGSEVSFENVYTNLGVTYKMNEVNDMIVTMRAYASLFRVLYNASYLSRATSNSILTYLSKSTFKKGIVAQLPPNIIVAHKFGERQYLDPSIEGQQLHDCGIVYKQNEPYILCIMTRGTNQNQLMHIIQKISKIVFDGIKL